MASSTILHMDMDAFFASVEQLDNPSLQGKCLVVGGSHRGVVAAASYEARKYGIRSAMPIFQARQKCPHLIVVPPQRHRYAELSHRIMDTLRTFSPLVEALSIDEAYVDITGCGRLLGSPHDIGRAVKARIREHTRLSCSVGIAPNKFLAKIASDMNKPDGLTIIAPEQVASFIETLPIAKVPGVGPHVFERLAALGVSTLDQVRRLPETLLVRKLGKFGHRLMELAHGRDDSPVVPDSAVKSVSSEITLERDTRDCAILATHLLAQSQTVARQLRKHAVRARTVTLKIKTAEFVQHTRSHTLPHPIQTSEAIYRTAMDLLQGFVLGQSVRLIGVGAGNLIKECTPVQQELFTPDGEASCGQWEKVDRVMDAIAERYGSRSVARGTLIGGNQDPSEN
jgi:DNA polymerase IV